MASEQPRSVTADVTGAIAVPVFNARGEQTGSVQVDAKMTLALSPQNAVALKNVTLYNTNSVEELLKQNFPNIRIETAVQYATPSGQLVQLIADEVQSGIGRTGKMFASEHFDLTPDIMTLAKGIASGMPLSATVARADLMNWTPGAHASTFGGNPVCISASLATIELLERELVANAARVGAHLKARLDEFPSRFPIVDVSVAPHTTDRKNAPAIRCNINADNKVRCSR